MKVFAMATAALVLWGCATPMPPLTTPSGGPEVRIQGATKKQVLDKIVTATTSKGMQVKALNDYGITVAKRMNDFRSTLIYGSRYDSNPEGRITFTLIEGPNGVHVMARAEMVTNPGSGFERVSDITSGESHDLQGVLEELDRSFGGNSSSYGRPLTPSQISRGTNVIP